MKILVTVLMTALFVFAAASTWVDYVQPQLNQQAKVAAEKQAAIAEAPAPRKRPRKVIAAVEPALLPVPDEESEDIAEPKVVTKRVTAAKAKAIDAEAASLLTDVKEQESKLAVRQEALKMIYDDIRSELAAVDDLRKQTREDMANAELRLLEVAQRAPRTTKNKLVVNANRPSGESAFIRSQALFIRKLADDGKIETAISVLKAMKERDAAGVLTSLDGIDANLADRLATTVQAGRNDVIRR
ncbi:MAG TPA: hypothetical protein VGM98_23365 [Schlesneria sp.]|jgi:hypothetical protein